MPQHDNPHFLASAVSAITGHKVVHSSTSTQITVNVDALHKITLQKKAPVKEHPNDAKIKVITLHGDTVEVSFWHGDTADHIKAKIGTSLGVSTAEATLVFNGAHIAGHQSLRDHGVIHMSTLHLMHEADIHLDHDLLVPQYNFDYRNSTDTTTYRRGGRDYHMPLGWYGIALNVTKYGDMTWLGMTGAENSGEWAVSYHGTKKGAAELISDGGFDLSKGKRFMYGHGVYSSPDPKIGESYATDFYHDGDRFKVMLQNRVNMDDTDYVASQDYYVTHHDDSIRPYRLLVKEY